MYTAVKGPKATFTDLMTRLTLCMKYCTRNPVKDDELQEKLAFTANEKINKAGLQKLLLYLSFRTG